MGCRGVHFSLDEEQVSALKATPEDQRVEHVQEEIEEKLWSADRSRGEETDKAWDAIHRALTDGDLRYDNGEYPLSHVVLGGEPLYSGEDYIISLKTPAQVRDVAAALKDVTREMLRRGYDRIDPASYQGEICEEDFEYTWSWLRGLTDFYRRAAGKGRSVIFTVDQ
jgi:hypothetical protein